MGKSRSRGNHVPPQAPAAEYEMPVNLIGLAKGEVKTARIREAFVMFGVLSLKIK